MSLAAIFGSRGAWQDF